MPNHRFGKHPAKHDYRTLHFKKYVTASLAAPPASFNVLTDVYGKLKTSNPTTLSPWMGMTHSAIARSLASRMQPLDNGLLGKEKIMPKASVVSLYQKLTGGPDTGLSELDVLKYWSSNKVYGSDILVASSALMRRITLNLFGGVYLGFQVQQNAIQEFDAHKPWTPGTLTNDGHCLYAVASEPSHSAHLGQHPAGHLGMAG